MTPEGDTVVLRPVGISRYFDVVFLGVWLAFWAVFEAGALAVFGSMLLALFGFLRDSWLAGIGRDALERAPGLEVGILFIYLFLIVWIALWTLGGLAAGYHFFRLLGGADRLVVVGQELHLAWRAGPVRRSRRFGPGDLRRVRIRLHDKAVVAETASGTTTLTDLGTVAEREAVAAWLRARLGLDVERQVPFNPLIAPSGWQVVRGDSGAIHLRRPDGGRHVAATIMWTITGIGIFVAVVDMANQGWRPSGAIWLLALLASAAAWVAWARQEWLVRAQQLDYRLQFGPFLKARTFRNGQLEILHTVDSDGDSRYKLQVSDATAKRTIDSELHDDTELTDLARWLESATGFRLLK